MLASMYAKLFSRIAQSSLMEEDVETRYCFMMLLAIADSSGDVIGTDVALARAVNLPLETFKRCVSALMSPDPDSNSQVSDGKRLVPSESGRGYLVVNYVTYRSIKTAEEKKSYMREYMKKYRKSKNDKDVTSVNVCKVPLVVLAQGEGEGEGESEGEEEGLQPPTPTASPWIGGFDEFWTAYPKKAGKGSAEKAWKKLGCSKLIPQILTAVRRCKISHDWTKDAGQFIPHPATWLNRRGWEDELTPRNGAGIQENLTPHIVEV